MDKDTLGKFENEMNQFLQIEWSYTKISDESLLQAFFRPIGELNERVSQTKILNAAGYALTFMYLLRFLSFLRDQPRLALFYKTLVLSFFDLFFRNFSEKSVFCQILFLSVEVRVDKL